MLLYLVTHSRSDLVNSVRKTSKVSGGTREGVFNEIPSVIRCVLDIKYWDIGIVDDAHFGEESWEFVSL